MINRLEITNGPRLKDVGVWLRIIFRQITDIRLRKAPIPKHVRAQAGVFLRSTLNSGVGAREPWRWCRLPDPIDSDESIASRNVDMIGRFRK